MVDEEAKRRQEFGELIESMGYTQQATADALEITRRMVIHYLRGTYKIPLTTLLAMRWLAGKKRSKKG